MARTLSLTLTIWLATSVLPAAWQPARAAPDDVTMSREVERALGAGHQRALPGLDAEGDDPARAGRDLDRTMSRRERRIDPRTGRPRDPGDRAPAVDAPPAGPLADIASLMLWGLVAVAAIVLAAAIYRQAAGYTGDEEAPPARAVKDEQLAAVIERPRDDADELAAHGRFADAIHTLLLRTLHELASQHLVRVTPSMTSREILAKVSLLGDAREALSGLIVAVEQTWFGDDVPQAEDYARCRAQFDRFATAYRRGAQGRA